MKFLQYNIQSLQKQGNKEILEIYLDRNKTDVAFLTEIWLKDSRGASLKDYNFVAKFREDGYGGVGFYIKKDIKFALNRIENAGEVVSITTLNLKENINLIGSYCPPDLDADTFKEQIERVMQFFEGSHLITI